MVNPIVFNLRFEVRDLDGVRIPDHLRNVIKVGTVMTLTNYSEMAPSDLAPFEIVISDGFFDKYVAYFSLIELASLLPLDMFDKVARIVNENYVSCE